MPFYEYECTSCKFYSEVLQKISDPPLRKCASCGRKTMKKLVSAPNFRLKGGGWYETDFKSDQENKRNLAVDKEPAAKSGDAATSTQAADAKAGDAKSGEGKASEGKTSDSKAAESKPAESKTSESRPAAASRRRKATASRKPAATSSKPRPKAAAKRRARR